MANLYADANFYITEINYNAVNGNNQYDVAWAHTGNNTTANFSVLADNLISNVNGTGKVITVTDYDYDEYPTGNAFVTEVASQSSTSNTGSGLRVQVSVDSLGEDTLNIVSSGTGYYYSETVTFPAATLHRSIDLTLTISQDDREGINYFPTGLSDAAVVANAVPLMNVEYGFS